MLRLRSGVGVALTILILAGVGIFYWLSRPDPSVLDDALAATPPPIPDTVFVGDEIVPPIPAPEFDLINHTDERVTNEDLKGRIILLSFAYTSCPDTCPIMFGRFMSVIDEFEELVGEDLDLVFVSVDPEVDTPERLSLHTELMDGKWYFLTEELMVMEQVWDEYKIRVEKDGNLVGHSNLTYLLDDQGLIRVRYVGLPPESVFVADIQRLMREG
jgi:protein SCO1/2